MSKKDTSNKVQHIHLKSIAPAWGVAWWVERGQNSLEGLAIAAGDMNHTRKRL